MGLIFPKVVAKFEPLHVFKTETFSLKLESLLCVRSLWKNSRKSQSNGIRGLAKITLKAGIQVWI